MAKKIYKKKMKSKDQKEDDVVASSKEDFFMGPTENNIDKKRVSERSPAIKYPKAYKQINDLKVGQSILFSSSAKKIITAICIFIRKHDKKFFEISRVDNERHRVWRREDSTRSKSKAKDLD